IEAGINPEVIGRAVAELESRKGLEPITLLGPSNVNREVRAVPHELSRDALSELVRIVDQEVADQGTVQEALGCVRWNSQSRLRSTQVSLEPSQKETLLRVEERYSAGLRGALHAIPTSYGVMLSLPIWLEGLNLGVPATVVLAALSGVIGWGVGDVIWRRIARKSRSRVRALAERLSQTASRLLPASTKKKEEDQGSSGSSV
ncbi:hypothetical protein ACFL3S_10605, partial [Gemmatimonadota bacterium]